MPEGDTLFRTAVSLHAALAGRCVTRFEAAIARTDVEAHRAGIVGARIEEVRSRGKHLLVRLGRHGTLRTHLGMHGAWHLYRHGSRWRAPAWKARVVIETETVVAVCFLAAQVEWIAPGREQSAPSLTRLGPDLLAEDPDLDLAARCLVGLGNVEMGVAVMDQTVMAGVGNVYKSEVLFACRLSPFALASTLDPGAARQVVETARRLLQSNVDAGPRRTAPRGSPLWVYKRRDRPCRRCGTPIRSAPQGSPPRRTYWCPACQAAPSRSASRA